MAMSLIKPLAPHGVTQKVRRLHEAFRAPFIPSQASVLFFFFLGPLLRRYAPPRGYVSTPHLLLKKMVQSDATPRDDDT